MRLTRRLINQPTRWAILFGKQIQNKSLFDITAMQNFTVLHAQ